MPSQNTADCSGFSLELSSSQHNGRPLQGSRFTGYDRFARRQGHLLLITQPDHAALAASMMSAWRADGVSGLAAARRRALRHHAPRRWVDGGGSSRRWSTKRTGGCSISSARPTRCGWPSGRGRSRGFAATPYAAALVAQHALRIFDPHRARHGSASAFFAEMQALRDRALADAAPLTLDDLVQRLFLRGNGRYSLTDFLQRVDGAAAAGAVSTSGCAGLG